LLKSLSYLIVIIYLGVEYGQNFIEFGSQLRKDYYFIGMSLVQLIVSFTFSKLLKNAATFFFFFFCIGSFINEVYISGEVSNLEVYLGLLGVVYILLEKRLKKWKEWLQKV